MILIAESGQIIPVIQDKKKLMPSSKSSYFIIKKAYQLDKDGSPGNCGDKAKHKISNVSFNDDELGETLKKGSDFLPPNEKVSVIINGEAVNPSISSSFLCGFALTNHKKEIKVVGDRTLTLFTDRSFNISQPEIIRSVPLRYELSYGGDEFARNPSGCGYLRDLFPKTLKKTKEFQGVPITGTDEAADVAIFTNLQKLAEDYQEEDTDKSTVLDKEIATKIKLPNFESIDESTVDPLKTYLPVNLCANPVDWSVSWTTFENKKEVDDFSSDPYTPNMYCVVPDDQLLRQIGRNERIELINLSTLSGSECVFFPDESPRIFYNIVGDLNKELHEPKIFQDTVIIDLEENLLTIIWKCYVELPGKNPAENEKLTEYVYLNFENSQKIKTQEEIEIDFEESIKIFDEFKKKSKAPPQEEVDAKIVKIKESLAVVLKDAKVDQTHIDVLNSDLSLRALQAYFTNLVETLGSEVEAEIQKVKKSLGV